MPSPLAMAMAFQNAHSQYPITNIAPTDVVGAYRDSANEAMQVYNAQLQQKNAMFGGLAGLGAAGIVTAPRLLGSSGALSGLGAGLSGLGGGAAAGAGAAGAGGGLGALLPLLAL